MKDIIKNQNGSKYISRQSAKYSLLDSIHGLTKALIDVALGCDVFPGINGIGPSKLYSLPCNLKEAYKEDNEKICDELISFMMKNTNIK